MLQTFKDKEDRSVLTGELRMGCFKSLFRTVCLFGIKKLLFFLNRKYGYSHHIFYKYVKNAFLSNIYVAEPKFDH